MEYPPEPNNDSLAFLSSGADTCPNCASDDVSWGDPEPEGDEVYRSCHCLRCGNSFNEVYTLAGLMEDRLNRVVLKFVSEGPSYRGIGFVTFGKDGLKLYLQGAAEPIDILTLVKEAGKSKEL